MMQEGDMISPNVSPRVVTATSMDMDTTPGNDDNSGAML